MSLHPELHSRLECPKTRKDLPEDFLEVDGIPWLYRDAQGLLMQWQGKANHILSSFTEAAMHIKAELEEPGDRLDSTKARLETLHEAFLKNREAIEKILKPLAISGNDESVVHYAVKEKIPTHQKINSYYDNIFRDWVWGEKENSACLEIIKEVWPEGKIDFLVALGAGACRLPMDIHQNLKPEHTLAVDINPLLLLSAKALANGEEFSLFEFPRAPQKNTDQAVCHKIKSSLGKLENFHYLFADVSRLPLKPKSVDALLTPWLIDIIPDDFKDFSKRLNRSLKTGGYWVNFGPLGFDHQKRSKNYSQDEVLELVQAAGFKILKSLNKDVPYLQSPHSGHGRVEKVFCFLAQKEAETKEPTAFHFLPPWLQDYDQPIPADRVAMDVRFRMQVQADILSAIDGNNSVNSIAKLMAPHFQTTEEQAKESLVSLLTRIHESSLRQL